MLTPRRAIPAATALALLLPATAPAAIPNIDTWIGKIKHHKNSGFNVYHDRNSSQVNANISVTCTNPEGTKQVYGLSMTTKIKHGKVKASSHKAYGGQAGYLKVNVKVPVGSKASGRVKWKLPKSVAKGCKGSGKITGKYAISHGG